MKAASTRAARVVNTEANDVSARKKHQFALFLLFACCSNSRDCTGVKIQFGCLDKWLDVEQSGLKSIFAWLMVSGSHKERRMYE